MSGGDPQAEAAWEWGTGSVSMKGFNKTHRAGLMLAWETKPAEKGHSVEDKRKLQRTLASTRHRAEQHQSHVQSHRFNL